MEADGLGILGGNVQVAEAVDVNKECNPTQSDLDEART